MRRVLIFALAAIVGAGCGDEGAPPPAPPEVSPVAVVLPEGPLVVYLGAPGASGQVEAFCTGLQIGPRQVLTIAHCGAALELPGVVVGYGARHGEGPVAPVAGHQRVEAQASAREGVMLVTLAPDDALATQLDARDWSRVRLSAPAPDAAQGWRAHGYGFGCDMRDASCCDPRVSTCAGALPWGDLKASEVVILARASGTVYTHPLPGALLCQGDSGSALWRVAPDDTLEVAGVYSASFLPPGVTLEGTGLEQHSNICVASSPGADETPRGRLGVYYNLFMDVCAHEAALKAAIPTLTSACDAAPWCASPDAALFTAAERERLIDGLTRATPQCAQDEG